MFGGRIGVRGRCSLGHAHEVRAKATMYRLLSVALALVLTPCLFAQTEGVVRQSFGTSVVAGEIRAGGPDYAARFSAAGATYLALSHQRGVPASSLRYGFTAAARGGNVFATGDTPREPALVDGEVRYERGGLCEVYAAQRDGIEQSFVIAAKPAGEGDLVVTGEITTDLPLAAASDRGLCFERDGRGVTFGAVTGVDANGATMPGSLSLRGNRLEMRLPAAFVEHAAYPLIVDPLIGTAFTVGDVPGVDDEAPAIAFDVSTNRYLVVWRVDVTNTQGEIRGQLLSGGPVALVGAQIVLANCVLGSEFAVANVNATNRFLVTYVNENVYGPPAPITYHQHYVACFSVAAASGAVSNAVVIEGGVIQDPQFDRPRVGGDSRVGVFGTAENALVVYQQYDGGLLTGGPTHVRTALVHVLASGDPVVLSTNTVATLFTALRGYVSTTAGGNGHWLVVLASYLNGAPGTTFNRLNAYLLDAAGNVCGSPITVYNNSAADLGSPSIATRDGNEFAVVWEDKVTHTIGLRRVVWSGSCAAGSWTADPLSSPIVQAGPAKTPSITFARDKYMLTWVQAAGLSLDKVYVKGLDPLTCASCGAEQRVDTGVLSTVVEVTPAIASRWSGGDTASDQAMVVWSNPAIRARLVEAVGAGGTVTGLGGGCGTSGFNDFATYSGLPTLGTTFTIDLLGPTAPVIGLAIGFSQVNIACGPCTLVGALDVLLPGISPTPIAVPCDGALIGVELYSQWVQLRPSGCPILPDIGLSNCLRFTIAE